MEVSALLRPPGPIADGWTAELYEAMRETEHRGVGEKAFPGCSRFYPPRNFRRIHSGVSVRVKRGRMRAAARNGGARSGGGLTRLRTYQRPLVAFRIRSPEGEEEE